MAPTFAQSCFLVFSTILLVSNAQSISTKIPSTFAYVGCYSDDVNSRTLLNTGTTSSSMTEESCIQFCITNQYPYAGVEYGTECYCGTYIASTATKATETDCNMACGGDATELCGGSSRINIFHNKTDTSTAPKTNPGPAGWGFQGCFVDSTDSRSLPVVGNVDGTMTVAKCTAACKAQGYTYAGVEYAAQCYCGSSISNSLLAPDGLTGCSMTCSGNSSEYCGGSNRLDVYGYGKGSVLTSTSTTTTTKAVSTKTVTTTTTSKPKTSTTTTTSKVATTTTTSKPKTSTTTTTTSKPKTSTTTTTSKVATTTKTSKASTTTTTAKASTTTTTTKAATTTTTTKTTTKTTTTTSAGPTGTGFTYRGCYIDNANGRILQPGPNSNTLTIESCISGCQSMGYTVAGMEYSTECYCGNSINNGGVKAAQDTDCNMACGGSSSEMCGGPNRVSVWATGTLTSYGVPVAKTSGLPGSWAYQGCLSDTPQPRVMPYELDWPQNLTINACLNICAQYGYSAASMEYGAQCFCGDDTDRINAGATFLAASQCNTPCPAEPGALCGGTNAMNYYTWANLNVWTQATGNAAGLYQFLIGGVVVPLITTVEINGKVLFTEKHGTSYNPNSTGAWEFDPSKVPNFNQSWRELQGLQTDVFCSAGLTLPDKAGRVINIGGWSGASTYGLRFYTPDGFGGTQGSNGWQENYNEVHLLDGRWYPGAMQMVNGSILVVGGENGSNGPPVPTLEVIPTPAGVTSSVYMDWLNRTDPNNLYPFLCVLPSGNIAVFYYNEARILDEKTFKTVRTLPNIPGAVNNFLAGRTYPLEGTTMLLPQSAPYSAPLSVLICGGSTPYAGIALDNCVSIQPEVAGQNWTIERMPSKRVISSMTALPDGTYLILNGAHQGMAGFGLATDPNLEAVLYDPTKAVNHRMTKMANTTIDRLYHSEAILLQDGRVLVSGSDPEDNTHPQEFRVEVFIPPYLMGSRAATRPDFQFQDAASVTNNLAYAQSFKIAVNSTVSKISFMAAVSSTHGNSMGQRTIFPAFSCATGSGSNGYTNICTITTPPNGYITGGPGWHQVFVLDASGTPSVSKWVRIGGDPAGLGKWPNFPDFTLPG